LFADFLVALKLKMGGISVKRWLVIHRASDYCLLYFTEMGGDHAAKII
tara:strand:- start:97 stop:240 length:144 start_codon:yes stop_codon:yes gene_type:complete